MKKTRRRGRKGIERGMARGVGIGMDRIVNRGWGRERIGDG